MNLLDVPFQQQMQEADCLAACAAMLLKFHNKRVRYKRLLKLLKIQEFGASFYNLQQLSQIGMRVEVHYASMTQLEDWLTAGKPVVIHVFTAELPHWEEEQTDHAIIAVGIDEASVWIHDPASAAAPIQVSRTRFELAWMDGNYVCATIER